MSGTVNNPYTANGIPTSLWMSPKEKPRVFPLVINLNNPVTVVNLKDLFDDERFTTLQSIQWHNVASAAAVALTIDQTGFAFTIPAGASDGCWPIPAPNGATLTFTPATTGAFLLLVWLHNIFLPPYHS